jgi:hypothetical protein
MDSGLATVKADGHRAILPGHTGVFWGRGGGYHVICGWICLVGQSATYGVYTYYIYTHMKKEYVYINILIKSLFITSNLSNANEMSCGNGNAQGYDMTPW